MPNEFMPWDDATAEARQAYIERWWALANPDAGSVEHLMLQMMSSADMGHGDPEAARRELIARGLYVVDGEHRGYFSDEGTRLFLDLYGRVA